MDTGAGGWRLTGTGIALLIVPVSGAAAVIMYVIFPGRSNGGRREP
jgi:hypothetical protein